MTTTELTVFTIGQASAEECRMVLGELSRQSLSRDIELIVIAPELGDLGDADFQSFGSWRWIRAADIRTFGAAAALAVQAANSVFVAYAEEHTFFDPNWAEAVLRAHEQGYDAVGFAMENANPETLTSWAHLYGQFGPVVAPTETRRSQWLAGHHVSYRTQLLLGYGERLVEVLEDESALFLDLRTRGIDMLIAGDAVSLHVNISKPSAYFRLDFLGQRSFAAARASLFGWPLWKRVLYAAAAPLIPLVRMARVVGDVRRSGRMRMLPILAPLIGLGLICGAAGEACGYLLGAGRSAELKSPAEFQRQDFLGKGDTQSRYRSST